MSRKLYFDYNKLNNIDLFEWHQKFFWPVSRETTNQIVTDTIHEQSRIVDELGFTFEGDCLLIGNSIGHLYKDVINFYLLIHRAKELNCDIVYSENIKLIPLLLKKNEIIFSFENLWRRIGSHYRFINKRYLALPISILNAIRCFKYNFGRGRYNILEQLVSKYPIYALPTKNVLDRSYTYNIRNWLRFFSPLSWYRRKNHEDISQKTVNKFKEISEMFSNFTKNYAGKNFGIIIPKNILQGLFNYTIEYLSHIGHVYSSLLKESEKKGAMHLFVPTGGKPFVRAISLAVKNAGGKVTGFSHGNYICHSSSPRNAFWEFSTVDEFLMYSRSSIPLAVRNIKINPPARGNAVKFVSENTPFFKDLWNRYEKIPLPIKHERVLILDLSTPPETTGYHISAPMIQFHFYFSIAQCLSENGFKVIIKKNPQIVEYLKFNLFKDIDDVKIEDTFFETPEVIEQADVIICSYAMSSTLFYSMCTNRTIIYIDAGWEPWFPDVYELMAKRCKVLHCWYDERNRQCFDKDELLDILRKPPEPPNTEFLERYLFPK